MRGSGGPTRLKITQAGDQLLAETSIPAGAILQKCVGRGEDISFSPASVFASLRPLRSRFTQPFPCHKVAGCLDLLGFRSDQRCGWRLGFFTASTTPRAILVLFQFLLNLFSMSAQLAVASISVGRVIHADVADDLRSAPA